MQPLLPAVGLGGPCPGCDEPVLITQPAGRGWSGPTINIVCYARAFHTYIRSVLTNLSGVAGEGHSQSLAETNGGRRGPVPNLFRVSGRYAGGVRVGMMGAGADGSCPDLPVW